MKLTRLLVGFLLCLFVGQGFAQTPTITGLSGGTSDGDTLTISGTGFGTHTLRYSFLGGPNGVTDSDSLRDDWDHNHIGDLHAKGLQGWQTSTYRAGNFCNTDTLFITRLRANTHVRENRKSSIVTNVINDPANFQNGRCYTNAWGFYQRRKTPALLPNRHAGWWAADTLASPVVYISWWEWDQPTVFNVQGYTQHKHWGLGTGSINDPIQFDGYHAGAGHFWAQMIYNPAGHMSPPTRMPFELYCACGETIPGPPCTCSTYSTRYSSDLCYAPTYRYGPGDKAGCGTVLTYSSYGKWTRHEVYVKANPQSGATENAATVRWKYQSPGLAEQCVYNFTPEAGIGVVTHAWDYRDEALNGTGCTPHNGPMFTWNKFTMWRFINYNQSLDFRDISYDDVYLQFDTRARVMVGNTPLFTNSTHEEVLEPLTWSDTLITCVVNRGAISAASPIYVYVINESESASAGQSLVDVTVETVLPSTANTGEAFWADFWVRGNTPWRAAAFKVYYDSTRVMPIKFDYTGADSNGCMAEFNDLLTGEPKVWAQGADADIWINYDKGEGVSSTDDVMVGRIQFLPVASGWARIQTSPSSRSAHYLGSGGANFGCMQASFAALDPAADTEAAIITSANGVSYVTPDNTQSWTTVIDSVNISGLGSDRCVGNWDGHPPKKGIPSGAGHCAPLAVVFTAQDSSISSLTDTLKVTMNVWADSIRSIEGYIEYNPECTDSTQTNLPISCILAPGVGFNQLEVDLDWGATHVIPFQVCTDAWPDSLLWGDSPRYVYFKASRSDEGQVSIAGPLLQLNLISPDPCQDQFSIGLPCQTAAQVVYTTEFVSMLKVNFSRGTDTPAQALERGQVYLFDPARYGWIDSQFYLFVRNLNQYEWGP